MKRIDSYWKCVLFAVVGLQLASVGSSAQPGIETGILNSRTAPTVPATQGFRLALQRAIDCGRMQLDEILGIVAQMAEGNQLGVADAIETLAGLTDCRGGKEAAEWMAKRGIRTAAQVREGLANRRAFNQFRRIGPENYGKAGSLSEAALKHRRALARNGTPLGGHRNVAVVEYTHNGKTLRKAVESSGTGKAAGHAERRLAKQIPQDAQVKKVFSERDCCNNCWKELLDDPRFDRATVEHAFIRTSNNDKRDWFQRGNELGLWRGVPEGLE